MAYGIAGIKRLCVFDVQEIRRAERNQVFVEFEAPCSDRTLGS